MAKEIVGYLKLQIKGGQANPAPPVGPALGKEVLILWNSARHLMIRLKIKWGNQFQVITVYKDKNLICN